jgi:hypothetical protein
MISESQPAEACSECQSHDVDVTVNMHRFMRYCHCRNCTHTWHESILSQFPTEADAAPARIPAKADPGFVLERMRLFCRLPARR